MQQEVDQIRQAKVDVSDRIRNERSVLHWHEYTSGLIEPDADNIQRKADATTLSEWRAATDEERERVLDVRRSRMQVSRRS